MSDERKTRVARNEAMYREVNERIEEVNEAFGELTGEFTVVCECGNAGCTEQIALSGQAYEQVRADPTHFIVKSGHQASDVESVVAYEDEYLVVEKHDGKPARLAEKTDPRR